MPSKPAGRPSDVFTVYGKGKNNFGAFELLGQLDPSTAEERAVPLECRKRMVSAAPVAAAAAVADEDDDDDADEELDYDELMALHEDAGLSVDDLRKRYASGDGGMAAGYDGVDDVKPAAKKQKMQQEDSDDDEDEYGF
jgi:hypothetical protein